MSDDKRNVDWLVRTSPEAAVNEITRLRAEVERLRGLLLEAMKLVVALLSPEERASIEARLADKFAGDE